jgi:hypothetical protein
LLLKPQKWRRPRTPLSSRSSRRLPDKSICITSLSRLLRTSSRSSKPRSKRLSSRSLPSKTRLSALSKISRLRNSPRSSSKPRKSLSGSRRLLSTLNSRPRDNLSSSLPELPNLRSRRLLRPRRIFRTSSSRRRLRSNWLKLRTRKSSLRRKLLRRS